MTMSALPARDITGVELLARALVVAREHEHVLESCEPDPLVVRVAQVPREIVVHDSHSRVGIGEAIGDLSGRVGSGARGGAQRPGGERPRRRGWRPGSAPERRRKCRAWAELRPLPLSDPRSRQAVRGGTGAPIEPDIAPRPARAATAPPAPRPPATAPA